jgi:hypothetical protein
MDKKGYLTEYIIQDVISFIMEDENLSIDEAMKKFYNSQIFDKLQDKETGLYLQGSGYIYDLYKIEQEYGYLVQLEV